MTTFLEQWLTFMAYLGTAEGIDMTYAVEQTQHATDEVVKHTIRLKK